MSNLTSYDIISKDCIQPNYDGTNLTNRVLVQQTPQGGGKKSIKYYCPAYMRIKIKNFSQMSLQDLSATINIVLSLTANFKGLPSIIQKYVYEQIILRFNRDQPIKLQQDNQQVNIRKQGQPSMYTYIVRKLLQAGMKADIFLSPFQIIYLILTVQIQQIRISKQGIRQLIKKGQKQRKQLIKQTSMDKIVQKIIQMDANTNININNKNKYQQPTILQKISILQNQIQFLNQINEMIIQFNLMDYKYNQYVKISYSEQGTFGNYDLAQQLLKVQYTNQDLAMRIRQQIQDDIDKKQKQKYQDYSKIIPYQNAHFQIPLYKFPFVTLSTIFIPLWLLGIINLGIFFQDTTLGDRIGSLSALMIAFVALLPVIRSSLPPNPSVTLVQILVYLQTITVLFCFIESLSIRQLTEYQFNWYQNGLFLVSLIIEILEIIIILMFLLIHKCCWERGYNKHVTDIGDLKFDYLKWNNSQCDNHFRRKLDTANIKIINTWQKQRENLLKKYKQDKQKKSNQKIKGK